jgi:hypothetical protein
MGRYLVEHQGWVAMWSTIVDAPISEFRPIEEVRKKYPDHSIEPLIDSLPHNRAGPREETLDLNEILWRYTAEIDDDDE